MFLPANFYQINKFHKRPLRGSEKAARASLLPPLRGSMTLEAAIAVPLFLFFVMNLLFVFEAVRLQSKLQAAVQQAGEEVSEAAYYTRFGPSQTTESEGSDETGNGEAASFLLSETYVRGKITSYLGEALQKNSCVVGGRGGLSLAGSKIMTEADRVDLIVSCRVRPFIRILAFPDFPMQVRYCGHAWVGWSEGSGGSAGDGGGNETTYVTEYGEVYHRSIDCEHLRLKVQSVPFEDLKHLRNNDRKIYYACEYCGENIGGGNVFITGYGERYHSSINCLALKRKIYTIPISEVGGRRACSTCG